MNHGCKGGMSTSRKKRRAGQDFERNPRHFFLRRQQSRQCGFPVCIDPP